MPNTYEYECGEHGAFEQREPMNQEHAADCPTCATPARRKYGYSGFFYSNNLYDQSGKIEDDPYGF